MDRTIHLLCTQRSRFQLGKRWTERSRSWNQSALISHRGTSGKREEEGVHVRSHVKMRTRERERASEDVSDIPAGGLAVFTRKYQR